MGVTYQSFDRITTVNMRRVRLYREYYTYGSDYNSATGYSIVLLRTRLHIMRNINDLIKALFESYNRIGRYGSDENTWMLLSKENI